MNSLTKTMYTNNRMNNKISVSRLFVELLFTIHPLTGMGQHTDIKHLKP